MERESRPNQIPNYQNELEGIIGAPSRDGRPQDGRPEKNTYDLSRFKATSQSSAFSNMDPEWLQDLFQVNTSHNIYILCCRIFTYCTSINTGKRWLPGKRKSKLEAKTNHSTESRSWTLPLILFMHRMLLVQIMEKATSIPMRIVRISRQTPLQQHTTGAAAAAELNPIPIWMATCGAL